MNAADRYMLRRAIKEKYLAARRAGGTRAKAFTIAEKYATRLLGTAEGAWDLATWAQDEIDPQQETQD